MSKQTPSVSKKHPILGHDSQVGGGGMPVLATDVPQLNFRSPHESVISRCVGQRRGEFAVVSAFTDPSKQQHKGQG